MTNTEYQLYFTDADLTPIGQFLDEWTELDIVQRFNDIDSYAVTMPASDDVIALAGTFGARIVILRNTAPDNGGTWEYFASGPIEYPDDFTWSADAGEDSDPGQITMQFADDSLYVMERITYPDYTKDASNQGAAVADSITGELAAETAMKRLVSRNAGPLALRYRQVRHLTIEADGAIGAGVTYYTRFQPLGDVLRSLAIAATVGGDQTSFGFRVVQVPGPALEFQVFNTTDLSDEIIYSRGIGNLRGLSFRSTAPTATVAIVGGDGTGDSRVIVEVADTDAVAKWRRIESFVGNDAPDMPTLTQAGQEALISSAETAQITATALDNTTVRYGVHYFLGDLVGVEVSPGRFYPQQVTAVTIKVQNGVETVTPTIGNGAATADGIQVVIQRDILRRLGGLERT